MNTTAIFTAELESLVKRHDEEVQALADRVRREVVIPACRKHNLRFLSGMGVYYFCKPYSSHGTTYGDRKDLADDERSYRDRADKLSSSARETLGPILDLLNNEVSGRFELGHFVADVGEDDLKEKKT